MFLIILGVVHTEVVSDKQVQYAGPSVSPGWKVNFSPFFKHSRQSDVVVRIRRDIIDAALYRNLQGNHFKRLILCIMYCKITF